MGFKKWVEENRAVLQEMDRQGLLTDLQRELIGLTDGRK